MPKLHRFTVTLIILTVIMVSAFSIWSAIAMGGPTQIEDTAISAIAMMGTPEDG